MELMEKLETSDIQGIIVRGYSELSAAVFLLIGIKECEAAKRWLKKIAPEITTGAQKPTNDSLNIALTFEGLKVLGLNETALESFPMELQDGMITKHKQQFLGDYGTSDPANWEWGSKNTEAVHLLLMLYAMNDQELNKQYAKYKGQLESNGLKEIRKLDTTTLSERKEHFGFHDGIAQPIIRGLSKEEVAGNTLNAGEFILGYKNEYDQYPESPVDNAKRDLGKNGSYLVFRQLKQDVGLFWKYMHTATCFPDGKCNAPEMIKLASKMTGRWPSGAPLVVCPDKDDPEFKEEDNFAYRHSDSSALKCPVSSHIRRTNPRDSLEGTSKKSIEVANKHRILRRGRSYGEPVVPSMNPEEIIQAKSVNGERGLHFICFNADISRQFEFIQNNWVNNPKFEELYDERDPITGNHSHPENTKRTGTFTIKEEPVRKRLTDVPEFINVKGGAYFFMPGIKALTALATI
jgi:Dyp-type peroxidase family